MDKAEQRKKLKGLQLLIYNRRDQDVFEVFDEVEKYIERERPRRQDPLKKEELPDEFNGRSERKSRDRKFRGGRDRGEE